MNRLTMTAEERNDFLRFPRVAILSVAEPDGGVLSGPVWYAFRPSNTFVVMLESASRKGLLARDIGRATLAVQDEGDMRNTGRAPRYVCGTGSVTFSDTALSDEELADYWSRYLPGQMVSRYFELGGDQYVSGVTASPTDDTIDGMLVVSVDRWHSRDYAKGGDRWDEIAGVPGAAQIGWEID